MSRPAAPFAEMIVIEDSTTPQKTRLNSITDAFQTILTAISLTQPNEEGRDSTEENVSTVSEKYFRMPSHNTHVRVSGIAARDVSSYFVQVVVVCVRTHYLACILNISLSPTPLLNSPLFLCGSPVGGGGGIKIVMEFLSSYS
jgi:hypothetical protein